MPWNCTIITTFDRINLKLQSLAMEWCTFQYIFLLIFINKIDKETVYRRSWKVGVCEIYFLIGDYTIRFIFCQTNMRKYMHTWRRVEYKIFKCFLTKIQEPTRNSCIPSSFKKYDHNIWITYISLKKKKKEISKLRLIVMRSTYNGENLLNNGNLTERFPVVICWYYYAN